MKVKLHPLNVSYISYNKTPTLRRCYYTSNTPNTNLPKPIFILSNLEDNSNVLSSAKRVRYYKKKEVYIVLLIK